MENSGARALISQLADDLGWLEDHCRRHPEQAAQAVQLRLASALVRNCIGPFLDNQPARPLHVAVVGGAGAGKSTVANFLSGAPIAEANPQAGFTRHPIAYAGNGAITWASHLGFLGPLQRLAQPSPANVDADVYQVRPVSSDGDVFHLLKNFVVWDCPDMTTWAATGYVPRLLEVAGLADVIVYVASDERYNDEVPTRFLELFLQAGKPVVVCLMKMRESDAPGLIAHFQKEVLSKMPGGAVACLAIPHLTPEQLADPVRQASRYRIPLLNQVAVLGEPPAAARRRAVRWATNYLIAAQERLLGVARQDLAALQNWRALVQSGKGEFEARYRREYLTSERFHRFDQSLVRLMELLELPNVGRWVSNTLWVLRTPYRLLKGALSKAFTRPDAPTMPELPVLQAALAGWLDMLRKEAARRASSHPVWAHIDEGFEHGLADQAQGRFEQGFRSFQLGLADEIDRTARAIYEELEKSPAKLKVLRGGKLAIDTAAIAGAVLTGGVHWGLDFVLVPLYASITHQLVELLGKQYVDSEREQARNRQQAMVDQFVATPLAEWLAQWPATGGSTYERLQLALRRIPPAVQQLDALVTTKLTDPQLAAV
ncbi:MAG TPA: GTPase domain-containing protein [Gemmataceae bacterium]|nr:GTPase domain-containing protein [Gemmataceae bacterium]